MDNNETRKSSHTSRPLARIRQSVRETVSGMRTLLGQINVTRSTQQLRESKRQKRKMLYKIIFATFVIIGIICIVIKRVF